MLLRSFAALLLCLTTLPCLVAGLAFAPRRAILISTAAALMSAASSTRGCLTVVDAAFSQTTNNNNEIPIMMSSRQKTARTLHRFFILRHGETDANASGIIQGSSDVSRLTERGRTQAAQAGSQVFGEAQPHILSPIDTIYVSPLTRAQETLQILRNHAASGVLPPTETVLHDLREIDLYSWEGQNVNDLKGSDAGVYQAWKVGDAQSFVVDNKLPIVKTWRRAENVWSTIRQELQQQHKEAVKSPVNDKHIVTGSDSSVTEQSTLLVCHGTLGQALLSTAFGWNESHFREHDFPNCGLVEIIWKDDKDVATSWRWHYPERTERLHPPIDTTLA